MAFQVATFQCFHVLCFYTFSALRAHVFWLTRTTKMRVLANMRNGLQFSCMVHVGYSQCLLTKLRHFGQVGFSSTKSLAHSSFAPSSSSRSHPSSSVSNFPLILLALRSFPPSSNFSIHECLFN